MDFKPPMRWLMSGDLATFDPVTAHLCCWCSYYSYYENAQDFFTPLLGATSIIKLQPDVPSGRPQGYAFQTPDMNIVVFAGTTDYSQLYGLVRDTAYGVPFYASGSALLGAAWNRMCWDLVRDYEGPLRSLMRTGQTIFTGHSLGGAIAAALLATLKGSPDGAAYNSAAYTFGCPRLGNKALQAVTAGNWDCIVPGDIVPKLPPTGCVAIGNQHINPPTYSVTPVDPFARHGTIVYVDSGGEITIQAPGATIKPADTAVEWDAVTLLSHGFGVNALLGPRDSVVSYWKQGIRFHQNDLYLRLLEKALPTAAGQHPELFVKGKVIEDQLPPDPTPDAPIVIVPPVYPTPPAIPSVTGLSHRRRH